MASIKGKDTKIELMLRKALWNEGIRGYRLNVKLPGKPDIVFPKCKIAIFCDGDFWHGKDFDELKNRLNPYWIEKIQKNIERDEKNDTRLLKEEWIVLHFWESDIQKNLEGCISKIQRTIQLQE
ncbi:MAG: very short patch repair endonuclease [Methanoregula sp.]|nr:very short patch repair endonuclease [Methanoregula sp.]